jgi:hypothetical protein
MLALPLIAAVWVGCGGGTEKTGSANSTAAGESRTPAAQTEDSARPADEVHADPIPGGEVQGYTQPTTPEVDARLTGETVVVRYRYPPPEGDEEEPWMLLTSIDPAGDETPATNRHIPLGGKTSGVIRLSLGVGDPPYELSLATLAANGLRGRSAHISLPG